MKNIKISFAGIISGKLEDTVIRETDETDEELKLRAIVRMDQILDGNKDTEDKDCPIILQWVNA